MEPVRTPVRTLLADRPAGGGFDPRPRPGDRQTNDDQANDDQANDDQANDDQANDDQANDEEGPMRSYHDPIEVRRGSVGGREGPEQFLWRDRLWVVRSIIASWLETGVWWEQAGVSALLGTEPATGSIPGVVTDLVAEREVWRVEAGRGGTKVDLGYGVFDLAFDGGGGRWELVCSLD